MVDTREREQFLREAMEAVERQRGGPWDRGDGHVILSALRGMLQDVESGWLVYRDEVAELV